MDRAQRNKRGGDADGPRSRPKDEHEDKEEKLLRRRARRQLPGLRSALHHPADRHGAARAEEAHAGLTFAPPPAHLMTERQEAAWTKKAREDERQSKEELERELEEGLEDTFPASDPPTATQPVHHEQPKEALKPSRAAAESGRSVRRTDRDACARTAFRQSRRAFSSRRPDLGQAPLGLAAVDLLRAALQEPRITTSGATATPRCSSSTR